MSATVPDRLHALGATLLTPTAAVALGEGIIARESELDGQLRAVHLRTHLATRASLTEIQLAKYQTLRGYDAASTNPVHKH